MTGPRNATNASDNGRMGKELDAFSEQMERLVDSVRVRME